MPSLPPHLLPRRRAAAARASWWRRVALTVILALSLLLFGRFYSPPSTSIDSPEPPKIVSKASQAGDPQLNNLDKLLGDLVKRKQRQEGSAGEESVEPPPAEDEATTELERKLRQFVRKDKTSLTPSLSPPLPPAALSPPADPMAWRTWKGEWSFDPEQRYLFYPRYPSDFMVAWGHRKWSMTCMAGEALATHRILVVDADAGLPAVYSNGTARNAKFEQYFDLWHLRKVIPSIDMNTFNEAWLAWDASHPKKKLSLYSAPINRGYSLVDLLKIEATILRRNYGGPEDYAFQVCLDNKEIERPWSAFRYAPSLTAITEAILTDLKWTLVVLHVERGDKLKPEASTKWPNLDNDTRPPHLLEVLRKKNVSPKTNLWIQSDETDPLFFAPLAKDYPYKKLSDYSYLWAPGSQWWKDTEKILGEGGDFVFDGMMMGIVEEVVSARAFLKIETFNDLTSDPKDGL